MSAVSLEQIKLQASFDALARQRDKALDENVSLWADVSYWKTRALAAEKANEAKSEPEKEPAQ